jgi:REP element-mobilizing transposase RayT
VLGAYVVMPNHVHATVKPLGEHDLESILGGWKGFTAKRINQRIGRRGSLWGQEAYDRIVRDAEHLHRILHYIGDNPRGAGIPKSDWVRWVHPEWARQGWSFDSGLPGSG